MPELIIFYIENTIPGLIYITSGFFIYLYYYRIYDLSFLNGVDNYLPYIFIILLAVASIIGFSCQKILQNFIYLIFEDFKYDAKEEIRFTDLPNDIRKRKNHFYVILVLIRHLVIGTFILWYSITKWLFGANKLEQISQITFILIPILILFCIVYALHRKTFKQIKEGINNILQSN